MSKTLIQVEITHSGQPRPYADHLFQGTVQVQIERKLEWSPSMHHHIPAELKLKSPIDPNKTFVYTELVPCSMNAEAFRSSPYAQLVHPWKASSDWFEPKLKSILELAPGKWQISVTRAFTD